MNLQLSKRTLAGLVLMLIVWGILTMWIPQLWAISSFQVGAFLLVTAYLLQSASGHVKLTFHPILAPVAFIVLWGIFQLIFRITAYSWDTRCSTLVWGTNLAFLFLAIQAGSSKSSSEMMLTTLVWFGFLLSVISTLQMYTSGGYIYWIFPSGYTDNVLGPFVNRNQYAAFIELLLPIALSRGLIGKHHPILYRFIAATMIASVVAAASRAGVALVLCEVIGVLLMSWFRSITTSRQIALAAGQIALAGLAFVVVTGAGTLWGRLQQPDPFLTRSKILSSSLTMARDRPWMGFGLGAWARVYPKYALYDDGTDVNQAHNDWIQIAVEGGVPAFLCMLAFALLIAKPSIHSLWGIGIIAFLIHALVDYPLQQRPALAGLFFVLSGLSCARFNGKSTETF